MTDSLVYASGDPPPMSDRPYRKLASKVVFENPWITLEEHQLQVIKSGHKFTYTYVAIPPSVMVIAITPERKIVLVEQYRYPSDRVSFELPGGGSRGLTVAEAASNELEEETGYRAGRVEKVGEFVTCCGLSDEICNVFMATELVAGEQNLEKTEEIKVYHVSYAELQEMIETGRFCDGMGLAALRLGGEKLRRAVGHG